jgi:hypothetical protein
MECKSPACSKDADCPTDMVCYAQTSTACSGGSAPACKPGANCEPVDAGQPVCTTETTHSCVPRYVPPCKQDADCGAGFKCVEQKLCSCSGGAARSGDGGVSTQPDSCSCSSSGISYCELQPKTCEAASDCPSGWTCEEGPNATTCATAHAIAGKGTADAGDIGVGLAPDQGCLDAGPPSKFCLPRYYQNAEPRGSLGTASAATDKGSTSGAAGTGNTHALPPRKSKNVCAVTAPGASGARGAGLSWLALVIVALGRRARRQARGSDAFE